MPCLGSRTMRVVAETTSARRSIAGEAALRSAPEDEAAEELCIALLLFNRRRESGVDMGFRVRALVRASDRVLVGVDRRKVAKVDGLEKRAAESERKRANVTRTRGPTCAHLLPPSAGSEGQSSPLQLEGSESHRGQVGKSAN